MPSILIKEPVTSDRVGMDVGLPRELREHMDRMRCYSESGRVIG